MDREELHVATTDVVRAAQRSRAEALPWRDEETRSFARYWFGDAQLIQLTRVARAVNDLDDVTMRRVLQIALSRIIVTKSPKASLAADTSHSRPHRVIESSIYDVIKGFEQLPGNSRGCWIEEAMLLTQSFEHGEARRISILPTVRLTSLSRHPVSHGD